VDLLRSARNPDCDLDTAIFVSARLRPGYDRGMDWLIIAFEGIVITVAVYRLFAFVRDLDRRDKLSRRPPEGTDRDTAKSGAKAIE